jgi:hypothetical protein
MMLASCTTRRLTARCHTTRSFQSGSPMVLLRKNSGMAGAPPVVGSRADNWTRRCPRAPAATAASKQHGRHSPPCPVMHLIAVHVNQIRLARAVLLGRKEHERVVRGRRIIQRRSKPLLRARKNKPGGKTFHTPVPLAALPRSAGLFGGASGLKNIC